MPATHQKSDDQRLTVLEQEFKAERESNDAFKQETRVSFKELKGLLEAGAASTKGDKQYALSTSLKVMGMIGTPAIAILALFIAKQVDPVAQSVSMLTATQKTLVETAAKQQDMLTTIVAQNATSISERHELHDKVETVTGRVGALEKEQSAAVAHYNSALTEIETQVAAVEQAMNLRSAYQERLNFITWQLAKLGAYPDSALPELHISNRNPQGARTSP